MAELKLVPAPPGTCPECAVAHSPDLPHNANSLHYQYRFHGDHGRWPDWRDAMAHCSEKVQRLWVHALSEEGIDVEAGQLLPPED